jgi:hypothetical protein
MPWKECSVTDERLRFVARLLDGEAMTDVCREFGISRRLQDLRPLQGARAFGSDGPVTAAGAHGFREHANADLELRRHLIEHRQQDRGHARHPASMESVHGSCLLTAGCHGPAAAEAMRRGKCSGQGLRAGAFSSPRRF